MKLNIDISNEIQLFKRLISWAKPRLKVLIPVALTTIFLLAVLAFGIYEERMYGLSSQMLFTHIAYHRAGNPIPFDMKLASDVYRPFYCLDCWYNSRWLEIQENNIVPIFGVDQHGEGLAPVPQYTFLAAAIPYNSQRSLGVAGLQLFTIDGSVVFINDRFQNETSWNDEREALSTLVHELIHAQGGLFASPSDQPELFEPRTQGATTEILASMCDRQQETACKSFWMVMFQYSKAYVMVNLKTQNLGWFYELWDKIFFLNTSETRLHDKNIRYWATRQEQYDYLITAYSLNPYLKIVIPALAGMDEDTGLLYSAALYCDNTDDPACYVTVEQYLKFDDTDYLLGWMKYLLPWKAMIP
jgi:hypothetical protein